MPTKKTPSKVSSTAKAAAAASSSKSKTAAKAKSTRASSTASRSSSTRFPSELTLSWLWSTAWRRLPQVAGELILLALSYLVITFIIEKIVPGMLPKFPAWLVAQFLSIVLSVGMTQALIQVYRGKKIDVSQIWIRPIVLWNFLLATVMVAISVLVGLVFFIIPGIYLGLRLSYTLYLVVDQELTAVEAFKKSWEITQDRTGFLFIFALNSILVILLGALAVIVGLLVAIPLVTLAQLALYDYLLAKSK